MKGMIKRIFLENFVTYSRVEWRPERNLNVIIGPNGTGKSTLLCAIVLGLGGKPKVVARGANVAAYVKEGCQSAKIEIELYNPDGNNYVVTRGIDLNNRSSWSINGKTKTPKDVETLTKELHIQVDNLCQFLPQDRVQDFAKMNNESLLENTEKSVGSEEMYEQHIALKSLRTEQLQMEKTINAVKQNAEKEQQLNEGNTVQVNKLNQKKQLTAQITALKQRHAWILYQASGDEKKEAVQKKVEAVAEQSRCEASFRPLKLKLKRINDKLAEYDRNTGRLRTDASNKDDKVKLKIRNIEKLESSLDELARQLKADEAVDEGREKEIEKFTQIIDMLHNNLESCNQRADAEVQAEIRALQPLIQRSSELIQVLQTRFGSATNGVEALTHQIRAEEAEKRRVENQLNNRLNLLRRRSPDVHTAVLWLRENKHRFRCNVYEPMVLEIDVIDPRYASFIESAIAHRDLLAFTCEDEEDMSELVRELRTNQNLSDINVVHSTDNGQYNPPDTIESLRRYGFVTYLREQMKAPKPIINYLCKFSRIHKVPVGRNVNTDKVPRNIKQFYSDKFKYFNSVSSYTNELSTSTTEVGDAEFFASSVDSGAMKTLIDRICQLNINMVEKKTELQQIRQQLEAEEAEINRLRTQKRDLMEENERKRIIQAKINAKVNQRQMVLNSREDLDELRSKYKRSCQETVRKLLKANYELLEVNKELHKALTKAALANEESSALKRQRVAAENASSTLRAKTRQAEEDVTRLERRILAIKEEQRVLKDNARALTDGKCPWEEAFNTAFPEFLNLSADRQEIEDDIWEREGRLACLGADNNNLLVEYEARLKKIATLTAEVETRQSDAAAKQAEMDRLQALWLPAVQHLIERINVNFGRAIGELGCAGEVSLSTGENVNDFHQYGISIKVTYRENQTLQQLNQHHQSGGERAVATAIYLISLQELTSAPFRCVDEINQGMDPINERHIFELLVKTTSKPGTAQYFLLTPKLLPNLHYTSTVNVSVVNNGKHCSKSDFNYRKYRAIMRNETYVCDSD